MLLFLSLCYSLDLSVLRWLIVSKTDPSMYLHIANGKVGVRRDVLPYNYDDDRIVRFKVIGHDKHKILFNNGMLCNTGGVSVCDKKSAAGSAWIIEETRSGYRLMSGGKCLGLARNDNNIYDVSPVVVLKKCKNDASFYWDIEIMPRNFDVEKEHSDEQVEFCKGERRYNLINNEDV